jgi:hypothetical protein
MYEEIKKSNELVDSRFYKGLYEEMRDKMRRERVIHEDKTYLLLRILGASIGLNILFLAVIFCYVYIFLI